MAPSRKEKKTTKTGRPSGNQRDVPGVERALMLRPGVNYRELNRYVPIGRDQEFCRCCAASSPGRLCNAIIKNKASSLSSHVSTKHREGQYHEDQGMAEWRCACDPNRTFSNFHSVEAHIRSKSHGHRGSSKIFRKIKDRMIRVGKDGKVIVPDDDGNYEVNDDDLVDECGDSLPALPKENNDEDDEDNAGFGGGHGFGLGQAQAVEVGH